MSYWEAVIFGLVQGLTEFLPISSTAHLVFAERILGHQFPGLAFEIFLHLASVLAVMLYYRRDLWHLAVAFLRYCRLRQEKDYPQFRFVLLLGVATAITGVIGVLLKDTLDESLKSFHVIGVSLLVTGCFLFLIERIRRREGRTVTGMRWMDGVLVGLGQAVAVIPGISRSGSTVVTALWIGLEREVAVRYAFLLSIPVILGSSVIGWSDAQNADFQLPAGILIVSFVTAFFASLVGIVWLLNFVRQQRLAWFGLYCVIAGAVTLLLA